MSTLYQRNMSSINPAVIVNIWDTINLWFIGIDPNNPNYKKVLDYCSGLGITIYDLDPFPG